MTAQDDTVRTDPTSGEFDRVAAAEAKVGSHFRIDDYYEIGREKIREFAGAVQNSHPAHTDEAAARALGYDALVAPATFISVAAVMSHKRVFAEFLTGFDIAECLHTDQRIEFRRPLVAGDRLYCEVYLHSFRQAAGSNLFQIRNVFTDDRDEVVVETLMSLAASSEGLTDNTRELIAAAEKVARHDGV